MKTLYIDCGMGAAGDMLTAALLEIHPHPERVIAQINGLGIPGVSVERLEETKCGIVGTRFAVKVHGEEEESVDVQHDGDHQHSHDHHHQHSHEHHHDHPHHHGSGEDHRGLHHHGAGGTHHHNTIHDIKHIIEGLALSDGVKEDVMAVYGLIADAESIAHGVPATEIHFHEVGAMDAIADITAVCLLMEAIAPERVVVSPIHVGSGQVKCAHGVLPVPAPATATILKGIPIYGGGIRGELCTPTGAALLVHFATEFGNMPVMATSAIGYGMGKKDFEAANSVRVFLGETTSSGDVVSELSCNLDDMTPEAIAYAMEVFFDAGALEVYTVPIGMKKSRTGTLLSVMCPEQKKDAMIRLMLKHTTTLGVRENTSRRYKLDRSIVNRETSLGTVREKRSKGYGVEKTKIEFEDLAKLAKENDLSLAEVLAIIQADR